jgi:hypothetical protein
VDRLRDDEPERRRLELVERRRLGERLLDEVLRRLEELRRLLPVFRSFAGISAWATALVRVGICFER